MLCCIFYGTNPVSEGSNQILSFNKQSKESKWCVLYNSLYFQDIRESQTLSRTVSLGANSSDIDNSRRKVEPAYSFVGMHCIFDECKSMGNFQVNFFYGNLIFSFF